jgi:hypothetical protein
LATRLHGAAAASATQVGAAVARAMAGGMAAVAVGMAMAASRRPGVSQRDFGGAMHPTPVIRLMLFAVLALAGSGLANAQQPPTGPLPPASTSPAAPLPTAQAAADQRITALQAQLRITSPQMPQWSAFAQAMRDNATSTDALFRQRAGTAASMTAVENMRSYAQLARAYADNTEALAQAFETLYGVLTPEQQQTIDALFRQQPAQPTTTQPYRR